MLRGLLIILFSALFASASAQVNTDSLESLVSETSGRERVKLLNDLCWELGAKDPQKAEKYGREAVELAKKLSLDTLLAQAYNDFGTLFIRTAQYDRATELLDSCIYLRKQLKDSLGVAKAISKLAVIDEIHSDYAAALEKNLEIVRIFEAIGQDQYVIATLYGNIAVIHYNMKQFKKSIEFNDKCYQIGKELENDVVLSTSLANYGNVYSKMGDNDKSLAYFKQALPMSRKINNLHSIAVNLNNIGSCYSNKLQYDSAEIYFEESLVIREKINDSKGIMSTKSSLGNIYRFQKNYSKAVKTLEEALSMSKKLKTKDNTKVIYHHLSELYNETGQFDLAYEYHVKFSNIKDSIWDDASSQKIAEMESKYESEKKDAEIQLLNKENALEKEKVQRQQLVLYGTGLGIFLLIGLSFTIYRGYSQKKKANDIITQQNEELNQYNEEILAQRDEIEKQKDVIVEKHEEIQDSINYAKRIQTALLTSDEHWAKISVEHFILFRPKDVVSGDFFWAYCKDDVSVWVAADCTGHGVPGAFMSMLGVGFLNEIVAESGITEANLILEKLKEKIIQSLTQKGVDNQPKDGMDIALCVLDKSNNKLQFAGAYNPLYIVRNNELLEYKANKQPIGKFDIENVMPFQKQEIQLEEGDWLYTFSDGYADQFGGENGKRFGSKRFKELLVMMNDKDARMQKMFLNLTLKDWMDKGVEEQVDDICIVGVKI